MENKQHFIRKYKVKVDMASQITNHPSFQTVNIRQGTNDEEVIYVYYRISFLIKKSIQVVIIVVVQSEFGSFNNIKKKQFIHDEEVKSLILKLLMLFFQLHTNR